MRKTFIVCLALSAMTAASASAQVRIERPLTITTTLSVDSVVSTRYASMSSYLQPTAREKLTVISTVLEKQIIAQAAPDSLVAAARIELRRQFPRMTQAQQDQMVFLSITQAVESMETQKDSMSDLSTEVSIKLQAYQERRSKYFEMLSNMLKKMGDTSGSIISNMK